MRRMTVLRVIRSLKVKRRKYPCVWHVGCFNGENRHNIDGETKHVTLFYIEDGPSMKHISYPKP